MKRFLLALGLVVVASCAAPAEAQSPAEVGHHTVKAGETWNSIATSYGVNVDDLQLANDRATSTSNTAGPRVGWVLHIPAPRVTPPTTTTTTTTPTTSTTVPVTTTTLPPTTTTTLPGTTTSTSSSTTSTTSPAPTTTSPATSTTQPSPGGAAFYEDFADPAAFRARFDYGWSGEVQAGALFGAAENDWPGSHDMSCGNPNQTHRTIHVTPPDGEPGAASGSVKDVEDVFYTCLPGGDPAKGHLMTSVNTQGYVIAWFSPKGTFTDVQRVCFDVSNSEVGGGKWAQVLFLTPNEYEGRGSDLGYTSPEFPPGGPSTPRGVARYGVRLYRNGAMQAWQDGTFGRSINVQRYLTDEAPRPRHCITDNEDGSLSVTIEQPSGVVAMDLIGGSIPNGPIRVVFEDDNYNPDKHYDLATNDGADPPADPFYTWHWDRTEITTR